MCSGLRLLVGAAMGLAVVGCATLTKESPVADKQEAVRERAAERWDLILKGKAGEAYDDFFSKASRQVLTRDDFRNRMSKTAFRTAEVQKVECAEELCKAWVRITYDHPMTKGVPLTMQENWILEGGAVWYVWSP